MLLSVGKGERETMKKILFLLSASSILHAPQIEQHDVQKFINQVTRDKNTRDFLQRTYGHTKLPHDRLEAEKELQFFKNPGSPVMAVIEFLLKSNYYQVSS